MNDLPKPTDVSPASVGAPFVDLDSRLSRLIDPLHGIKRGIIDRIEPGKGSPDADSRMIPVSIGEIREVHAVLTALAQGKSA